MSSCIVSSLLNHNMIAIFTLICSEVFQSHKYHTKSFASQPFNKKVVSRLIVAIRSLHGKQSILFDEMTVVKGAQVFYNRTFCKQPSIREKCRVLLQWL